MWVDIVVQIRCTIHELGVSYTLSQDMQRKVICAALVCLLGVLLITAWALWQYVMYQGSMMWADYMMRKQEARKKAEVILVMESPMPTKTLSSPFPRSSARRPMRGTRAQRAGLRRLPRHRRGYTATFNPKNPGDCGFESVLFLAGILPNKRNIGLLRQMSAMIIEKTFIQDGGPGHLQGKGRRESLR